MQATAFAGLDVHATQTHVGVLDARTGELVRRRLRGEPARAVISFLEELGPGGRAVYEAGPPGFALPGLPPSAASTCASAPRG